MGFWCDIAFIRLGFRFECRQSVKLPAYKGSAFRGAFGHALKRVACALRQADCADCLLRHSCVYNYVFKTPPPPDSRRLRLYPSAPHPFILRPPLEPREHYAPGDHLEGELILIGRAVSYLPYFVYALEVLGERGLGRGRGRCSLVQVQELNRTGAAVKEIYQAADGTLISTEGRAWQETIAAGHQLPNFPVDVELDLLTPLRLKFKEKLIEKLELHHLIRNLLRRLASLAYFHCGLDPDSFDFKGCIQAAEAVAVKRRHCSWQDWARYSSRQQERMLFGGIVGQVSFSEVPSHLLSLLLLGEQLHVGKTASFGLGQYRITSVRTPDQELDLWFNGVTS
ncbi:MAG: CRISPR system precrRNA processing endoribonuclease RAMP protein Cas6 [Desulfobacteraceae bacterium]